MAEEANNEGRRCCSFFKTCKPYLAMVLVQFGYAGLSLISKISLNHGMSHYVLVVYRHAFATVSIAPFAIFLERRDKAKITFAISMKIFALALIGPVIDQNLYYAGLQFTSPTFASAMCNVMPAVTFLMAVLCRMEKVDLKKVIYQAKVVGTVVTVAGAMVMTLYKGPIVDLLWTKHVRAGNVVAAAPATDNNWIKGSIFLILSTFAWASFFILQTATLHVYSAQLSLTTLICFVGTLQGIGVTLVMESGKAGSWAIGLDMNLLAAAYAGIVNSSITYYLQGLVIEKKGPVFASAFSPLTMIIVAIMGSFVLAEDIYLGGTLGAVLIVGGLYSVLWGKQREMNEKEKEAMVLPLVLRCSTSQDTSETDQVEIKTTTLKTKAAPPASNN
ncbi:hypothetical protein HPP92_006428 [Vanilla planifolia]|uniref:WAT1-related protein n=1 Tax=Vanilla planifolia TaxID=51239 RepID=A0A835VA99_VANPL|nr:hypothetical protein HPP92_006428 [Vanilla planifolia]